MADYYACTELAPLLEEIKKCFEEANGQEKPLTLTISNCGETYPYVLRPDTRAACGDVHEVTGKALDMLRADVATAG